MALEHASVRDDLIEGDGHTASPRWGLALVVIGGLALCAALLTIDNALVGVAYDDAMYVILARSIATGEGFRYLNVPGHPAATHFPPGFPAVLAAISSVAPEFPDNVVWFKGLNAVAHCASAVLVARLVRDRLASRRLGIALGALTAISMPLLILDAMVLSEPLFLALLVALLIAGERFVDEGSTPRMAAMLGACIGAGALVRTHGIVLVPALMLPLLLRRRWLETITLALAALVVLLPWQLWSAAHAGDVPPPLLGHYGSYAGWWLRGYSAMGPSMIPATLARTSAATVSMLASLTSPFRDPLSRVITVAALAVVTMSGTAVLLRRAPVTVLFLAGYLAIVLLWPFTPARFVWGVWPLLLFVAAAAAWTTARAERTAHALVRSVVVIAVAWLAIGYAAYEVRGVRGRWWRSIAAAESPRISAGIEWAAANALPGEVLASESEGATYLYTGHATLPIVSFTTERYLRVRPVQREAADGLGPVLDAYPVRTVLVGTPRTLDIARVLTTGPRPRLAPRAAFRDGAAFTVLPR
ncbi:MAG: hypothetical protein H0W68_04560 [Gemmatimonadaceae bacterium]|nr:hypothetical protein [Gemmatimonadaceae bacterium]